jgi:HTH-like domain
VKQWRGTQRYLPIQRVDEDALTRDIITLASQYGRYGYRRMTALLRTAGWQVGKDRVQRIWRREGLKIPKKQRPRRRLWLNDGSCVRLRPERANHVWSYDFVSAMTHDGRTIRMLTMSIPFRPANRAEQNRVSRLTSRQRFRRKWCSGQIDSAPAEGEFNKVKIVSKLGGAVLEDAHSHAYDFRANAIARQQNNLLLLTGHFRVSGGASPRIGSSETISTCRGETV